VTTDRFALLARELALRDRDLAAGLEAAGRAAANLRERAERALEAFRDAARGAGAAHLADVQVGPVEPDEKHVDCVQFRVWRGRWEMVCVAKASEKITLVGPFARGKPEKPCADFPLDGSAVEAGLADRLLELLRVASER
jgi:hypothetical protein